MFFGQLAVSSHQSDKPSRSSIKFYCESQEFISTISSTVRSICFCLTAIRPIIDFCMRQRIQCPIVSRYPDIIAGIAILFKISCDCINSVA